MDLKQTLDQMNPTDTSKTFHPTAVEYTFFSNANGIFFRIDHMIVTKQVKQIQEDWNHTKYLFQAQWN